MEKNKAKYSPEALTQLPQDELRRILVAELNKAPPEIDDNFVRLLLAELQNRGDDPELIDNKAVEAACEKFRTDTKKAQKLQKCWYQNWIVTVASVVLVLGILFFTLPASAQADDLPKVLGWWSDSVFQFIRPGKKPNIEEYVYETDYPGLQQVYDVVTELGITEPIVPRWIPDGLELTELKANRVVDHYEIFARFASSEQHILILITLHAGEIVFQQEKDENLVEIWNFAGCEHYAMSNIDEEVVTWITNGMECTITTNCLEEDVYKIVKSIYPSED